MFVGEHALGPLEGEMLRLLWSRGDATVRELRDEAGLDHAYTTVMTTLDRLYKKGVLVRTAEGKAFRYRPAQTQAEYDRQKMAEALRALMEGAKDAAIPISFLVEAVTQQDGVALEELARAVERKRRDLKRKGAR